MKNKYLTYLTINNLKNHSFNEIFFCLLSNGTYIKPSHVSMTNADNIRTKRKITVKNPNAAVLTNANQTRVTPFIQNLTKGLFKHKLITVKQINDAADDITDNEMECDGIPIVIIKPVIHWIEWVGEAIVNNDDNNN